VRDRNGHGICRPQARNLSGKRNSLSIDAPSPRGRGGEKDDSGGAEKHHGKSVKIYLQEGAKLDDAGGEESSTKDT